MKGTEIIKIFYVVLLLLIPIGSVNLVGADDPAFVLKWTATPGCTTYAISPVAIDADFDGIMEVFVSGDLPTNPDKVFCYYGNNGTLKWTTSLYYPIITHNPLLTYDLDNDGNYEVIQPGPSSLEVLNAEDGTLYWRNGSIECSEAHQLVLDTDQNGYPYIYSCNADDSIPYEGKLRKIDGRTGITLISVDIWYPCHGGLSAADVDNDGDFEIFMTDRSTGLGKGIQCYDADTLDLIWYKNGIFCNSHLPVIVDVNNDGILDVVVSQQRTSNAGLYCIDGLTGAYIPGKYQSSISGLAVHEAFPVYDIDNDGNLELASCVYSSVKVFDLGSWQIEATLAYAGKPPYYANVMGDEDLEIIISDEVTDITIYSNQYQLLYTIPGVSTRSSITQDIDGDGLNELITHSNTGIVRVYDTLAAAPNPLPRTNTNHYSERNTRTGVYIPPPGTLSENNPPSVPSNPSPAHGATNLDINTDLSWTGGDPDAGDTVTFDVYFEKGDSTPDVLVSNDQSGTSYDPGILENGQTYYWKIISTDNHGSSTEGSIWSFSTIAAPDTTPPAISSIGVVTSDPIDTESSFGWENFSCTVTDNVAVSSVKIRLTNPHDVISNVSMTRKTGSNIYYYRTSLSEHGNYSYSIWARDTSGNTRSSNSYMFSLMPNWDMNNDGECSVLDQISISNHYGDVGVPGWIREDVDNNGRIQVLDFILMSNHYGESWWD